MIRRGGKVSCHHPGNPCQKTLVLENRCHVVKLPSHSQEYRDVAAQFNSTPATGGAVRSLHSSLHLVQGQASQGRIVKFERIQNSKLYAQYTARKKALHMVEESTLPEMPHIPQVPDMLPLMSMAISICTWPGC